jgi:hypothetical protein
MPSGYSASSKIFVWSKAGIRSHAAPYCSNSESNAYSERQDADAQRETGMKEIARGQADSRKPENDPTDQLFMQLLII